MWVRRLSDENFVLLKKFLKHLNFCTKTGVEFFFFSSFENASVCVCVAGVGVEVECKQIAKTGVFITVFPLSRNPKIILIGLKSPMMK